MSTIQFAHPTAIRALYLAWDAAIGAPWYTRDVAAHFESLSGDLERLRSELTDDKPDATRVGETLRHYLDGISEVKESVGQSLGPH